MLNFREFDLGPDPFGRNWHVLLKWLQNAISIRRSDTVDVRFILQSGESSQQKTVALPHPDLRALSARLGRELTDAWCGRLAAEHLKHIVETGEDMEKETVTPTLAEMEQYARGVAAEEAAATRRGAA